MTQAKKQEWFSKVETIEDANKIIKENAIGFMGIGAFTVIIGYFFMPSIMLDAAVFIFLGFLLYQLKSRVVAVLLLLLSIASCIVTFSNKFTDQPSGGGNIYLALLIVYMSVRVVQATFKHHKLVTKMDEDADILDNSELIDKR